MDLTQAADQVARGFLTDKRRPPEFHVAVARNAILDCLHSSAEPDFIAKICGPLAHPQTRLVARRVVRKVAPHLVELAGQTLAEAAHAD